MPWVMFSFISRLNQQRERSTFLFKKILIISAFFVLSLPVSVTAQNANSSTVRPSATSPADQNTNRSITDAEFRSEEHTSELQSQSNLVCRLLLEKKKKKKKKIKPKKKQKQNKK